MSESDLHQWVRAAIERFESEYGNDSYSGVWKRGDRVQVIPQTFKSGQEALEFIEEYFPDKWGPLIAARVGDHTKQFELSASGRKLAETLKSLKEARHVFEYDIYQRTLAQKSSTKKCSHCASVTNVKALPVVSRQAYLDAQQHVLNVTARWPAGAENGVVCFVLLRAITDCFVCGKNLMLTATDEKRKAALVSRLADVQKRFNDGKTQFNEKVKSSGATTAAWVVGRWCPS